MHISKTDHEKGKVTRRFCSHLCRNSRNLKFMWTGKSSRKISFLVLDTFVARNHDKTRQHATRHCINLPYLHLKLQHLVLVGGPRCSEDISARPVNLYRLARRLRLEELAAHTRCSAACRNNLPIEAELCAGQDSIPWVVMIIRIWKSAQSVVRDCKEKQGAGAERWRERGDVSSRAQAHARTWVGVAAGIPENLARVTADVRPPPAIRRHHRRPWLCKTCVRSGHCPRPQGGLHQLGVKPVESVFCHRPHQARCVVGRKQGRRYRRFGGGAGTGSGAKCRRTSNAAKSSARSPCSEQCQYRFHSLLL